MANTDSFTSAAHAVATTSATFASVESLTSSASAIATAVAALSDPASGLALYTHEGFLIRVRPAGVYVSKASTFGGTQAAVVYPITRDAAVDLALALLSSAD